MKKQICIIDYGIGNLLSIERAIEKLGQKVVISNKSNIIKNSSHLILPGVGAFGKAMDSIKDFRLNEIINDCANQGKFIMGICLGMQLLCNESEEFEVNKGLNLIPGKVVALKSITKNEKGFKIPNIGWLEIFKKNKEKNNKICKDIKTKDSFYFIHSFVAVTEKKYQISNSLYCGHEFQAIINKENIYGVQFHPERSGEAGLKLLNNFINLC